MSENLGHNINDSRERGERLRRIRNLANLTRKNLCEESGININTYIGYEVGRYGGLTKSGAKTIIDYVEKKGVFTSFEWLMFGTGAAPAVVTEKINVNEKVYKQSESHKIIEELSLFMKHYENSVNSVICDDGMLPIYKEQDYVAGIILNSSSINKLIGCNCIVKLQNEQILVRNLRKGKGEKHYTLGCINPLTTVNQPIIYDVKLIWAAKIIWHRSYVSNDWGDI